MTDRAATLPTVAAIVTEYRPRSHADVIVSKLLADYTQPAPRDVAAYDVGKAVRDLTEAPLPVDEHGALKAPRVRVVSLYMDQVPANDIGREWAERAGVPIFPTVEGALTLGGEALAVDGVLIIAEHGDYPLNERGQKEYPRRRLFDAVMEVFKRSGRAVPVFNDKHLGFKWEDARYMVDTARKLGFPMAAGSSISVTPPSWRTPRQDLLDGFSVDEALAVGFGPVESYGFHTLEVLQSVVERRAGGETGIAAVQTLSGEAVWDALAAGRWSVELLSAALATHVPAVDSSVESLRTLAKKPAVFLVEYRDGLRAAVPMLDGAARSWLFAGRIDGQTKATRFRSHNQEPFGHFAWLVEDIQDLVCTGQEPHPVERTLLTTGILDRAMESLWRGGTRLETPELAVRYTSHN